MLAPGERSLGKMLRLQPLAPGWFVVRHLFLYHLPADGRLGRYVLILER